jgi:hypothetical protein
VVVRDADAGAGPAVLRPIGPGRQGVPGRERGTPPANARVPAQARLTDLTAERIVLAGLMRAPEVNAVKLRGRVWPADFGYQVNGWLFAQCLDLWRDVKATPLDLGALFGRLATLTGPGLSRADFGPRPAVWLWEVYESDPTGAWCGWAAGKVRNLAERRRIIHAARVRIRDAEDGVLRV